LVFSLSSFLNPANGLAGSLQNLQNQVSNETAYKKQLEAYMTSHNMSFGVTAGKQLTIDSFGVSEMEDIVKSHMEYCMSTNTTERVKNKTNDLDWGIIENNKVVAANC